MWWNILIEFWMLKHLYSYAKLFSWCIILFMLYIVWFNSLKNFYIYVHEGNWSIIKYHLCKIWFTQSWSVLWTLCPPYRYRPYLSLIHRIWWNRELVCRGKAFSNEFGNGVCSSHRIFTGSLGKVNGTIAHYICSSFISLLNELHRIYSFHALKFNYYWVLCCHELWPNINNISYSKYFVH